jgi:hypothetical protein
MIEMTAQLEHVMLALYGGAAAMSAALALVFLRYLRDHRDRLFGFFAAAFACFATGWAMRFTLATDEDQAFVYIPRLIGFLLIIVAIFDKNQRARAPRDPSGD